MAGFEPATFPTPTSGRNCWEALLNLDDCLCVFTRLNPSGWQDSNLRPPAPKAGAMNQATLHPENSGCKYHNSMINLQFKSK